MNSVSPHLATSESTDAKPQPFHKTLDYLSIIIFPVLFSLFLYEAVNLLLQAGLGWSIAVLFLVGWLGGDWLTGIVHWFCDTYGSEDTPILGEAIIHPFREHHVLPEKITTHDFFYTNGNSFLLGIFIVTPFLIALYFCSPGDMVVPILATITVFTGLFSCLANQVHKWSHTPAAERPRIVRWLQRHHLILNPEHHKLHHTKPFDSNYCISCGWMNPVLEYTRFFRGLETMLRWLGLRPAAEIQAAEAGK